MNFFRRISIGGYHPVRVRHFNLLGGYHEAINYPVVTTRIAVWSGRVREALMPRIIGVHGIGQQFEGEQLLEQKWLPALRDGLTRAGCPASAEASFAMAFYGDLFRGKGKSGGASLDVQDLTAWEVDLLRLWWEEAARTDQAVRSPELLGKGVADWCQRGLNALSRSKVFNAVGQRFMVADLKQVRAYVTDKEVRLAARKRVEAQVNQDTRVIVGHSLGSVVAYEALCANPQWPVTHLVTLGSPLGIRNLIFDALDPGPLDGRGQWPGSVSKWTNISADNDVVAFTKALAPLFGEVIDKRVLSGQFPGAHDASRYLSSEEAGEAIADGLR